MINKYSAMLLLLTAVGWLSASEDQIWLPTSEDRPQPQIKYDMPFGKYNTEFPCAVSLLAYVSKCMCILEPALIVHQPVAQLSLQQRNTSASSKPSTKLADKNVSSKKPHE